MRDIKDIAPELPTKYLRDFFAEKDLPEVEWELTDQEGNTHFISNAVVVEHMINVSDKEAEGLADMLRRLDFHNADVNDYLKHLAGALINRRAA